MKETYYKLNREKLESAENRWEQSIIEHLIKRSFLEEVQEESKQAIDNMFGDPLGQVDNMIEGTKVEEGEAPLMTAAEFDNRARKYAEKQGEKILDMLDDNSKPFLDGMTPSDWIDDAAHTAYKIQVPEKDQLKENDGAFDHIVHIINKNVCDIKIVKKFLDLLVEELKRNNLIK